MRELIGVTEEQAVIGEMRRLIPRVVTRLTGELVDPVNPADPILSEEVPGYIEGTINKVQKIDRVLQRMQRLDTNTR